jgi:hypothetical protein
MPVEPPTYFLSGIICGFNLVASLFFLRFYTKSRDRLFLFFSGAFAAFALNSIVLRALSISAEDDTALYVIRLIGFGLILVAIIDKNRKRRPAPPPPAQEDRNQ